MHAPAIREYAPADLPAMIAIWNAVVEAGDAFPQEEPLDEVIQGGGVTVNDQKISDIYQSFSAEELKAGLHIRKGKKVHHKAIL